MLRLFHKQLNPGGVVLISLPNDGNPLQEAARQAGDLPPWWIAPPHHLNYFTVDAIVDLVSRSGFSPLSVQGSFPMEFFLLFGENYVGDGERGRECHAKRKAFELALRAAGMAALKTRLYEQFASLGLGRTTQVLARRLDARPGDKEGADHAL
jgi:hypothetical protein